MELEPGRRLFKISREAFSEFTGQDLYPEGWEGLTSDERQNWNEHAYAVENKDAN